MNDANPSMTEQGWRERRYDVIHQRDIFTMFDSAYLDRCLTSGKGSVIAGIPKAKAWMVWTDPVSMDIVLRFIPV